MSTATLHLATRDATLPKAQDGLGVGAVLALLVHLLLIVALAFGVNWRAHEPEAVVAELWSATPQVAAPRAVAPPPAPAPPPVPERRPAPVARPAPEPTPTPDAQIAIEQARRDALKRQQQQQREAEQLAAQKKAEREKAEHDKARAEESRREQARKEQAARDAEEKQKREQAEKARKEEAMVAAQREAYLRRIQGQAGATGEEGSTGTAARSSGPSANYAGRIRARIKPNIVFTDTVSGNAVATVEVRCAPDGTIVSRKLVKSSGSTAWDDSVLRAIDRTEILPRDTDGRVPPVMQIDFKPRD